MVSAKRDQKPNFISLLAALPLRWIWLVLIVSFTAWPLYSPMKARFFPETEGWILAGYFDEEGDPTDPKSRVCVAATTREELRGIDNIFAKGDVVLIETERPLVIADYKLEGRANIDMDPTWLGAIENKDLTGNSLPVGTVWSVIDRVKSHSCDLRDAGTGACKKFNPWAIWLKVKKHHSGDSAIAAECVKADAAAIHFNPEVVRGAQNAK
jgi:hypothetical protein